MPAVLKALRTLGPNIYLCSSDLLPLRHEKYCKLYGMLGYLGVAGKGCEYIRRDV